MTWTVRHRPVGNAIGNFEQSVLARSRVEAAFETGGGRAEHHAGIRRPRAHDGHVAAVIARGFFLLVAGVVFFIDHNQAEIAHGSEDSGACSDHNAGAARANSAPLIGALGVAEGAVQNRHAVAESRVKLARNGGRQRNLRHQHQRTAAAMPAWRRWR